VSQETSNRSFDELARALAEGSISRRGALKLFAGSAIAALIPSRALAQQQKVTICHKPGTPDEETIVVSQSAVAIHLRHGDQLGACVVCLPNGGTCMANDDCCSGRCADSTCAEPCSSDRVLLSNGTCVIEFPPDACFCNQLNCGCCFEQDPDQAEPRVFCCISLITTPCPNGHSDCPEGQFCEDRGGGMTACAAACPEEASL